MGEYRIGVRQRRQDVLFDECAAFEQWLGHNDLAVEDRLIRRRSGVMAAERHLLTYP
jgi:hypothetical protein